jgi:hypothetical protein
MRILHLTTPVAVTSATSKNSSQRTIVSNDAQLETCRWRNVGYGSLFPLTINATETLVSSNRDLKKPVTGDCKR